MIFATGAQRSYLLPWQVSEQDDWSGSGFAVLVGNERRVVTNAHVVDGAHIVQVTRPNESKKYEAEVCAIAHDLDLGLLAVNDSAFWSSLPDAVLASTLPPLFMEVKAIGYAEGGTTICVTKGVVSRIDASFTRMPSRRVFTRTAKAGSSSYRLMQQSTLATRVAQLLAKMVRSGVLRVRAWTERRM